MLVRTRVAPSPTGDPHLGTAYVALFNLVFARVHGGRFVLRIEDTDRNRSRSTSEKAILDALSWLGLNWDEGPDIGGEFGPYRSSERSEIYRTCISQLIEAGGAFPCFCSSDRLVQVRQNQRALRQTPKYDGRCLSLTRAEAGDRLARGDPHVVRLRVPDSGECVFWDGLRGEVRIPWAQTDMQVLLKSDGLPTYHFAVVVDDHLMRISHVFRGEEWISSFPKHRLLYDYFGWDLPRHYHLPLLRNPDHSKISKRHQPTGINYFRRKGYRPEAVLTFLAMMGWSMPDERELFSLEELVSQFDVDRLSTAGPVFDIEKLEWMNGQYLRRLSQEEFATRFADWAFDPPRLTRLVEMVQNRTERFSDLVAKVDYLLGDVGPVSAAAFEHKSLSAERCKVILHYALRSLEETDSWTSAELQQLLRGLANRMEMRFRDFLFPLFVAVSGRPVALPLFDSLEFLERDVVRARLRSAIESLGGVSKKQAKSFEAEWPALHTAGAE